VDEGPTISWRIAVGLVGAGIGTFAIGVGGWIWFSIAVLPAIKGSPITILVIPGSILFVMLLGFIWYQIFSLILTVLRADEYDS
jgi:hypothetical protein